MRHGLILTLLAAGAVLAACGQAQPAPEQAADETSGTPAGAAVNVPQGDLSRPAQLALGTIKLEGTALAVTREQSPQLAFLWQAYGSMSRSDTAAPQELEALVTQIEGAMTFGQLQAIGDMALTREAMLGWVEESGLAPQAATRAEGEGSSFAPPPGMEGGAPRQGGGEGGGPPGGMGMGPAGGDVGGMMGGSDALSPEMQATLQVQRPAAGAGDRIVLMLLEPLIDLLNTRAGG